MEKNQSTAKIRGKPDLPLKAIILVGNRHRNVTLDPKIKKVQHF